MIKEITLAVNSSVICSISLPICDYSFHPEVWPKTCKHVQVIRHEKKQRNAPVMLLLIETRGIKKYFRGPRMTEVIRALWLATDGHEENGIARANKMRRIVR